MFDLPRVGCRGDGSPDDLPFGLRHAKMGLVHYGRKRKEFSDFSVFGIDGFILADGNGLGVESVRRGVKCPGMN